MNNPENFFTRLSELMREQGLTQDDIARGLGTRQSTVSHWVQGVSRPRARTMKQLADFLHIPVPWLDNGVGPREAPLTMRLNDESLDEVYKVRKPVDDAEQLRNLDAAKLHGAVPGANTRALLAGAWTGLGDLLDYRIPFDSQSLDKIKLMVDELVKRAPPATGYTPPIDPTTRPS